MTQERRPVSLSGKQRRALRGLAHDLSPVVSIGKEGVTEALISAVGVALDEHELIKVRVLDNAPLDRRAAGPELAEACFAHAIGTIGRITILYRRHPSEPKVPLPA